MYPCIFEERLFWKGHKEAIEQADILPRIASHSAIEPAVTTRLTCVP